MTFWLSAALTARYTCGKWKPVIWIGFYTVSFEPYWLGAKERSANTIFAGMLAEEVLLACDENNAEASPHGSTSDLGLANPAVHFFRGLRHRNLNAIRHATQRGIHQLQQLHSHNNSDNIFLMKNRSSPLTIQGLRTNPKGNKLIDIECMLFIYW